MQTASSRFECRSPTSFPMIIGVTLSTPPNIYIIVRNHHHHHHVVLPARISLTLSRHFSRSLIASDRSSGLHPVSSHSCCMYVRAGRPAFARPYVGVHSCISLMISSLLIQLCPACLARLTWIVFVMGGRWPYSWCCVGCCHQDLFSIARNILVYRKKYLKPLETICMQINYYYHY